MKICIYSFVISALLLLLIMPNSVLGINKYEQESFNASNPLSILLEGNKKFITGEITNKKTKCEKPIAIVVVSSHLKIPTEVLFNQKLGNLFVIRTSNNKLSDEDKNSIKYGVENLGIKLVVVLGNQNLKDLEISSDNKNPKTYFQNSDVVKNNVTSIVEELQHPEFLSNISTTNNDLKIVGAYYNYKETSNNKTFSHIQLY